MFSVAAPFWSGGGGGVVPPGEDYLSIGTPTASALTGGLNTVAAQINTTSVLVVYQDGGDYHTKATVVTDIGGGAVSFSTPVTISSSSPSALGLLCMHVLDANAGTYICTYGKASGIHSRIVTVSAGAVTVTGTEDLVASAASVGEASLTLERDAVISASFVGVAMVAPTGVYVVTGSVSGGTVTYGTPTLTEMGSTSGQGSRLLTGDGGVVMYGAKYGVADNRLWACSVSSAGTAVPAYLTATASDRIHTPTAGIVPGPMAQIGANVHVLIEKTTAGEIYATRAEMGGGIATFSNSDADPNVLDDGPYSLPTTDGTGMMVAAPSTTKIAWTYRSGTAWHGCMLGVSGNVNMAGNVQVLTPTGASSYVPAIAFLSEFTFIMVWSASSLLQGQVCGIGSSGGGPNIRLGAITVAAGTSTSSAVASTASKVASITPAAGTSTTSAMASPAISAATITPAAGVSTTSTLAVVTPNYLAVARDTVTYADADAISSFNGTTWSTNALPAGLWSSDVVRVGGNFIAVAYVIPAGQKWAATSTDAVTWTDRTTPVQDDALGWYGLAHNGSRVVAIGQVSTGTQAAMYSDDYGVTWTIGSSTFSYGNSILYASELGLWIALALESPNAIQTSSNGITFTARTTPDTNYLQYGKHGAWSGAKYRAVARDTVDDKLVVLKSTDGTTYTKADVGLTYTTPVAHDTIWTGTKFVALVTETDAGATTYVIESTDGDTWTQASQTIAGNYRWVIFDGTTYRAFSRTDVRSTTSLSSAWSAATTLVTGDDEVDGASYLG